MSSSTLTYPSPRPPGAISRWRTRAAAAASGIARSAITIGKATAKPAVDHVRQHAYSIMGLGFIDAAAFVHSLFAGLFVTGITFLLFEWKVSD